ncbi:MAG TPA: SpoIIIAH-like family protein [Clostridiales bacterium]|nr:SpoIIIAH-like family protein [Clostridiales bacterium]
MKIKKRTAIAAVVALLVCTAVYLDWSYQKGLQADRAVGEQQSISDDDRVMGQLDLVNGTVKPEAPTSLSAYFAQLRLTRQKARDEAISMLEKTTNDEAASKEAKEIAVSGITMIAGNAVTEARIEGLILSKGYADCAVFLNEEGISIVVAPPEGGLKSEDAIRIKDIVVSETDVSVNNIRIIEARIG